MIKADNLTKEFKSLRAVDNLSLRVPAGEIYALLGENGAGKTTTLRMLATMLKPTGGGATICGKDILKEGSDARGHIGILFGGEAGLYDRLTAAENIRYFANLNGVEPSVAEGRLTELAGVFGFTEYLNKRAGGLSKGTRQKVAFARAIIHDPEVMLFDEPTAGLDVTAIREAQDFIARCRGEGKAIILSSHSMSEVERLADRVGILHKGRLMDEGTIKELLERNSRENLEQVFQKLTGVLQ